MRYLLIMGADDPATALAINDADEPGCASWILEMTRRGVLRETAGLCASGDATTIRMVGPRMLLTDGPLAETKEQIGGFAIIECANLDEALEAASLHPAASQGMIEVRPVRSYRPVDPG